ncbi:MAG: DUF2156 domain-containing protein [Chloroflexi bacterium]|nr:DUF2156 domain-containing protein [Chloroflexota bacterium]
MTHNEIPEFPGFALISLEHKPAIDAAFARLEPTISEFTFTNLFMWRHHYGISVSRAAGFLLVLARPEGKPPFFFPPWGAGDADSAVRRCLDFATAEFGSAYIERVPQDYLDRIAGSLGGLEVQPDPANDDYVYNAIDLIELTGRKYDGKRNAIRKFEREYRYEYRPMGEQVIPLCLAFQDYWCDERHCLLTPSLVAEDRAIREVLANFGTLGVRGGVILIDGKVEAFSFGECLNRQTFVVHVEKANPNIFGLYAVINQRLARSEASSYQFINREQDLGDEGLRRAKESYQPAFKVKKYRMGLKA